MSAPRRGATTLRGILLVDKPRGLTSHDVVARVRRVTGERRVGHAGTLDPMATGLLVVLVGPYTRLEPYLSRADKAYDARIAFGRATSTDDAEGVTTEEAAVPSGVHDEKFASLALSRLLGESLQTPPQYSAIKVAGRTAHRVARAGGEIELSPRQITVSAADLMGLVAEPPSWDVSFIVSKGTYIRGIARDLGPAVGSVAHLSALRRTASGSLSIAQAVTLEHIEATRDPKSLFIDPLAALGLPVVDGEARMVFTGRPIPASLTNLDQGAFIAVSCDGQLCAIYTLDGEWFVPATVFPHTSVSESALS